MGRPGRFPAPKSWACLSFHGGTQLRQGSEPIQIRILTDTPSRCQRLPDGHLDFDSPCNVLVHQVTKELDRPRAQTRLSLRCSFQGRRGFEVDGNRFVVHEDRYLLFNLGQHVSEGIESSVPVECLNVTFEPDRVEEVFRSLTAPTVRLLDEPQGKSSQSVSFLTKTYPHDDLVSPFLFEMRERSRRDEITQEWLAEQFHFLLEKLLLLHDRVEKETEAVPAMRHSTRVEIYHRLALARDYMEASLRDPISLPDYASVACLSPHHFLRLFKAVYGETPHQTLTRLRLERAVSLLRKTDIPITDLCFLVGFTSLGSFSTLFKENYGVAPTVFRKQDRE